MTEARIAPVAIDPEPLLVDAPGLATLLDISERQVHRLDSGGKLPAPITLGRCKRWDVQGIKDWLVAGAPPRARWNLRSPLASPRRREQGL